MPVYLLHGDAKSTDPYEIKSRLNELLKGVQREGNLNFQMFDLSETGTTIHDVVSSAMTIPFLGGQRVVVAKNVKAVEKFFKKKDDDAEGAEEELSGKAESIIASIGQLKNLPAKSILVLVDENEHLDGRTAFIKALKDAGCKIEMFKAMWFDAASGDIGSFVKFVQQEASKLGIRLDTATAERFTELVGSDRGNILKELEKLSIYCGKGSSPKVADVESVVTESYEAGIFHLVDVIGMGKTGEALKVLGDLIDRGAAEPYILTMIARQIRLIARVREALDNGIQTDALASVLKEAPFTIKKVLKQTRMFSKVKYPDVLEWLMETDVHLKRSTMPSKLALEMLITRLARQDSGESEPYEGRDYHSRRGARA